MSKASDFFAGASGGTPLGGTVMIVSDSNDLDIGGARYLRSGFVEPITAGLDPSVINDGVYFENIGNPITIGDRLSNAYAWAISDDEQHIGYHHADGGQSAVFSHDGGLTWSTIAVLNTGYAITGICTDGVGNWLITGYDSGVGSQTKSSIDNGVSWQTVSLPSVPTTARSQGCWHSRETGEWMVSYESNNTTGTDGAMYYNTTNVTGTWTKAPVTQFGIQTSAVAVRVLPPKNGNGTWFCYYGSGTTTYYISMSKDGGASWVRIAQDGISWPHQEFIAGMYTVADKPNSLFIVSDGDEPGSNGDVLISEIDIQVSGTVNSRVIAKRYYPRSGTGTEGMYSFLAGGFSPPENRNYKGSCYLNTGWVTTDGVSFRQLYQSNDDNAGSGMMHYIANDSVWYMYQSQFDNLARSNFQKMVPVAGVGVGYNEGASAQFVRIK